MAGPMDHAWCAVAKFSPRSGPSVGHHYQFLLLWCQIQHVDMTTWTTEKTFKFIDMYRNEPCIWNPKDKSHKHKQVYDSWERISSALGVSVVALKRKKESLMTAFRFHLKKKKSSIGSCAVAANGYKPSWIFYEAMEVFLMELYDSKAVVKIEDVLSDRDDEGESSNSGVPPQLLRSFWNESTAQNRNSFDPLDFQDGSIQMDTAFPDIPSTQNADEECDIYSKLLAIKLKQFSPLDRIKIMYEIDGLIMKKRHILYQTSTGHSIPYPKRRASSPRSCGSSPNSSQLE